jgi:hypothetical protein
MKTLLLAASASALLVLSACSDDEVTETETAPVVTEGETEVVVEPEVETVEPEVEAVEPEVVVEPEVETDDPVVTTPPAGTATTPPAGTATTPPAGGTTATPPAGGTATDADEDDAATPVVPPATVPSAN